MIGRRGLLGAAVTLPALVLGAPAIACRAAAPKDHGAYTEAIDRLFAAWWRRDLPGLRRFFEHQEVPRPFDPSRLFARHFAGPDEQPSRGAILFNGATAVVQIVTPEPADPVMGICGGMARGELFLVAFFPGLPQPVVERVSRVGFSTLAAGEWRGAEGETRR